MCVCAWGVNKGYSGRLPNLFIVFASEQPNMCTLSWHTSGRAEVELFSNFKSLNVGEVIQPGTDG